MRIAIISDIHSNLEALQRTLEAIHTLDAERIYCLGDIVGYGPYPHECLTLVREQCWAVVQGNHDSGVVGTTPLDHFNSYGREAIRWTTDRISAGDMKYLKSLPMTLRPGNITLVHASPLDPPLWTYVITRDDILEAFTAFKSTLCFIGHTHRPVIAGEDGSIGVFQQERRYIINVGSVGQPRDGNPESSFGFLDTRTWTFDIHRVPYDIDRTAKAIREAGLPEYLARRLYLGL